MTGGSHVTSTPAEVSRTVTLRGADGLGPGDGDGEGGEEDEVEGGSRGAACQAVGLCPWTHWSETVHIIRSRALRRKTLILLRGDER